jgi:uncharacterized RDD family membrane protein YckC
MSEGQVAASDENRRLPGFWVRFAAFFIDGIILQVVGWALGFAFWDAVQNLHSWGRLIGFAIALAYLALLDSRIGGGQTLGKRVMKIAVVGRDGQLIGPARSAVRYTVLGIPLFLNGIILSALPGAVGQMVLSFLVAGLGFAIVYLAVANRRTRQSLHDLVATTFVVRAANIGWAPSERMNRAHLAVVAASWIAALAFPSVLPNLFGPAGKSQFAEMEVIRDAVATTPGVWGVTVLSVGAMESRDRLVVTVFRDATPEPDNVIASRVAAKVLDASPDMAGAQRLTVSVQSGFDIGIASHRRGIDDTKTAAEWRASLK